MLTGGTKTYPTMKKIGKRSEPNAKNIKGSGRVRLYADNVHKFINKELNSYRVSKDQEHKVGKVVTLYSDYQECDFKIKWIYYFRDYNVLLLEKIEGSEHKREVISNYYAGVNPND